MSTIKIAGPLDLLLIPAHLTRCHPTEGEKPRGKSAKTKNQDRLKAKGSSSSSQKQGSAGNKLTLPSCLSRQPGGTEKQPSLGIFPFATQGGQESTKKNAGQRCLRKILHGVKSHLLSGATVMALRLLRTPGSEKQTAGWMMDGLLQFAIQR